VYKNIMARDKNKSVLGVTTLLYHYNWLKIPENSDNVKYLPTDVSYDLTHFEGFMEKRQKLMSDALKKILL